MFINYSSPRSLSPAHQTDGYYDDIDDYSPVVSDIEDPNDDDIDSKGKSKRKDDMDKDKDNNDVLQRILNEQSASCEIEDENVSDQGEHDDADESKESMCMDGLADVPLTLMTKLEHLNSHSFVVFFAFREREGAQSVGHFGEKENRQYGIGHPVQRFISAEANGNP